MGRVGKVKWKKGNKYYVGELIPKMETSTSRFARMYNGKIRELPKYNSNSND